MLVALLLSVGPTVRPSDCQDTSAIDRGVRIGIIYRPGVRPGMVVLPGRGALLDSVHTILNRDLDYSDRFELITLPGGDSIRVSTGPAGGGGGGVAEPERLPPRSAAGRRAAAPAGRRRPGAGSTIRCTRRWGRTSPLTCGSPPTR